MLSLRPLLAAALLLAAAPARAERVVCYKATSLMWDSASGGPAPTSPEVLERLHHAFRLWERASAGALRLEYAGFSGRSFDGEAQLPDDGCIHAVLHGERNFHGELAHGRSTGEIPDAYRGGYFFVARQPSSMRPSTLAHEIGHALGLPHSAVPRSIMFSGSRSAGAPSDQDAADLRARWAPGSVYQISGVIKSGREHPMAAVFAEDVDRQREYSARSDPMGRFRVALLEPGRYRLVARPIAEAQDLTPAALSGMAESWYVSDGASSRSRDSAAVLTLTKNARSLSGLALRTIDEKKAAAPPRPAEDAPAPRVVRRSGARPPLLRLTFDGGYDDEGPLRLKGTPQGDEVRLVPGVSGRALFVGGTKDWLEVALSESVRLEDGFSLEFWFRRDDWTNPYRGGSGWQTLASLTTDASVSLTAPGCPLHKPWALEGHLSGPAPPGGDWPSSRVFSRPGQPARRWTHAAFVYDPSGASVTLYLDGTRVDQAKGAPVPEFKIRKLTLGTWYQDNQAYRGEIDEVEVYGYPRSAEEVAAAAGYRE